MIEKLKSEESSSDEHAGIPKRENDVEMYLCTLGMFNTFTKMSSKAAHIIIADTGKRYLMKVERLLLGRDWGS